jgi:photosystem II stability/assembly factor-like uncharacterized protein
MKNRFTFFAFCFGILILQSCCRYRPTHWENPNFKYASDSTYSRAITSDSKNLYIGNSDGFIYKVKLKNFKSKKISKKPIAEIRDIAVTGKKTLVSMQSNDSSVVLNLKNRKEQTQSLSNQAVFLDGMDILPSGIGFLMGDPVDGFFTLYKTSNFGIQWTEISPKLPAEIGEAGFAASGSTVHCLNDSTFVFVSGGMQSRFFKSTNAGKTWQISELNYPKSNGSGPFSLCVINPNEMVIVGGDYTQPENSESTSFFTIDGGLRWIPSEKPTLGYRSCVIFYEGNLYACGTTGIDISKDKGKTWEKFQEGNYFAMHERRGKLFVSIPDGKIEIIQLVSSKKNFK